MTSSILNDVKHTLGLTADNEAFDQTIMIHVNTVFGFLHQLGVGPVRGYEITSENNTWDEFVNDARLNPVKSYIYLRVRLLFDSPSTGFETAAIERQIQELEYRINVSVDYG